MPAILTYNSIQTSGGLHAPVVSAPVVVTGGVINPLDGNYFQASVSGDVTFSLTALPGSVTNSAFTLEIQYTSGVITWFSGIQWSNGISPIPSVGTLTYTFITQDGGTTWKAAAAEVYVAPAAPPAAARTLNLVGVTYNTDGNTVAFPAGTAAGDLCVYFDHPNSGSGNTLTSVTPTSSGGSWTSLGGIFEGGADSGGAWMWYRILNASDVTGGTVSGRSSPTGTGLRKKSLAVFRISSGSISTATVGIAGGLTDTGTDTPVAITSSAASSSSIVLDLMLVSMGDTNSTVTSQTLAPGLPLYSESLGITPTQYIAGSNATTNQIGAMLIQAQGITKQNVTWTHSAASSGSTGTVRNYIVVT